MIKIKDVIAHLEGLAPLAYQESYDNSGLIVGDSNLALTSVLITLDCTEAIVDEAIAKGTNLIIAHHPIVFTGLKSLTGKNYIERTVIKAIKNDIAIYAAHTNLDNVDYGVSKKICDKLNLVNTTVLAPKSSQLVQLSVFVPKEKAELLRVALGAIGAGALGNYDNCSFSSKGDGRFRPLEHATPYKGKEGQLEVVEEERIDVVFPSYMKSKVLDVMRNNHPYEEVAHFLTKLENVNTYVGSGMVGELSEAIPSDQFLSYLKVKMNLEVIRHTPLVHDAVKRIAVCGGSGSFLLSKAKQAGADVYITGDFKYHEFFDAEEDIIIADIGHYESEVYTKELFCELLTYKFPTIVFYLSETSTNPVVYFK